MEIRRMTTIDLVKDYELKLREFDPKLNTELESTMIAQGDYLELMKTIKDKSINICGTLDENYSKVASERLNKSLKEVL